MRGDAARGPSLVAACTMSGPSEGADQHMSTEEAYSWKFPVEAGDIMLFARALGDPNPIYSDAEYARTTRCGGIIAPPTFLTAQFHFNPDFSMRPQPGAPWLGSSRTPSGLP